MTREYETYFKEPVRFRLIEKRTRTLLDFAESIRKDQSLLSIACNPLSFCDLKRCFVNVEDKIKRSGGRMLTGWIFNELEERTIEAEAHAIWVDKFGKKKLDITPHRFQPKRVLFLPDSRVALKRGYTAHPRILLSDDERLKRIKTD